MWPAYLDLGQDEWGRRVAAGRELMRRPCRVCPRYCTVDRTDQATTRLGFCRVRDRAYVASAFPHFGEEDGLRGWRGSGTIFFGSCNLACIYCQNWDISQRLAGHEHTDEELAGIMLRLQDESCHNINLVSPSIYTPQIVGALAVAAGRGLRLPLVYNTSAYDSLESLRLMDGIVDVYMPDTKYSDDRTGGPLSLVRDYWTRARAALKEMHRQVGDLQLDEHGLARRGVLVRHLVLPGGLAGTRTVMRTLATELSPDTYVNIMGQYHPDNRAWHYPPLHRRVVPAEVEEAYAIARQEGLHRFDQRLLRLRI